MGIDKEMELIGQRIASARESNKLLQEDVAAALGVHVQTISRWERGVRTPDASYLVMLTRLFGCTADYLLGLSDDFNGNYR